MPDLVAAVSGLPSRLDAVAPVVASEVTDDLV
ncbi:Uncharacterised protein [Mycobacterium tuberculosis]|nr:Uncharacterised protein [Mycobacterium tuberculosis]